ncbi:hypothetical protein HID58_090575 [Brassica napus]|uniref:AT-hook motif nuclear-localized protein n=1 Tax=Brassica napus TaxID=3708 RepID=A0ABQ7WYZ2_BRANA|nr:hypothetical protein HID58_090575 [Brassica napus]
MDQREAMALSGSGSYYIQRGMPGSAPPQTQASFYGLQGFQHFSNPNSPFVPNLNQGGGSTGLVSPPLPVETSQVDSPTPVALPPSGETFVKRKRGRPRKYGQTVLFPWHCLLQSPPPPPCPQTLTNVAVEDLLVPARSKGLVPLFMRTLVLKTGGSLPSSSGMSFTPHVIAVSVGEDIASKVVSFSQQSPRAICVLSVTGAVSTATILQPSPSQGAIKYEVIIGSFIWAIPKGKIKKRNEDVQETDALGDNTAATSPDVRQQSHNLVQTPAGMWSIGSRSMDMHHAHMDIDLMRG